MWKVSSFKKRRLVLEVGDFVKGCVVERIRFTLDEIEKTMNEYQKKYSGQRYDFQIMEYLDIDYWED